MGGGWPSPALSTDTLAAPQVRNSQGLRLPRSSHPWLEDARHKPSSSSRVGKRAPGAGEQQRQAQGRAEHGDAHHTSARMVPVRLQLPLSAMIERQAGLAGLLCDLVN